jgi:hypothetical protein
MTSYFIDVLASRMPPGEEYDLPQTASMNRFVTLVALACLLAGPARSAGPPLAFPAGTPLEVFTLNGEGRPGRWTIDPSDPRYARMQQWLADNRCGWSESLAPTPREGLVVSAGGLRVHFIGTHAFACRDAASCLQKTVGEADYRFLLAP